MLRKDQVVQVQKHVVYSLPDLNHFEFEAKRFQLNEIFYMLIESERAKEKTRSEC